MRNNMIPFLLASLALAACSAAPMLPPSDGGVPDAAPSDVKIINPSRFNTVLGRPTDRAVSLSVLAAAGDSVSVEYGAALDAAQTAIIAPRQSPPRTSAAGEPVVIDLDGLEADRRTYYRVHYTPKNQPEQVDALHSFRTQRAPGQTFHFGVQGDTHPERANNLMFHADLFTLTMQQVRDRQPDLYFLLGDDFSIEDIIQTFKTQNYGAGYAFRKSVEGALPASQYQQLAKPFAQPMLTDGTGAQRSNAAYLEMRQRYLGIAASALFVLISAAGLLYQLNPNHLVSKLAQVEHIYCFAA